MPALQSEFTLVRSVLDGEFRVCWTLDRVDAVLQRTVGFNEDYLIAYSPPTAVVTYSVSPATTGAETISSSTAVRQRS